MTEPNVLVLRETVEYENPYLKVTKQTRQMPDGHRFDYYLKSENSIAVCVPVDRNGNIVAVREYRPGPDRILLEIPGGILDEGEDPIAAASREVLEETGYAGRVEHLGSTYVSAYSNMVKHIFVMWDAVHVAEPAPEQSESLVTVVLTLEEFEANVLSGNLTDLDAGLLALRKLAART